MIVIHPQKRDSYYLAKGNSFASDCSHEAEISTASKHKKPKIFPEMESAQKSSKSVRFSDVTESYDCDKSPEENESSWITVS